MNDSNLGFFHVWLARLAGKVEHLYVVCLQKGEYKLPENVTVLSLGKEEARSLLHCYIVTLLHCYIVKLLYCWRFYIYIWKFRNSYDGVFVHMNPEYAILGGLLWRIWNKKILLWYTHKAVNLRLWLAEKFVDKIFTASKESFRLLSDKVEIVGHGIDGEKFTEQAVMPFTDGKLWILGVGRISESKDWETVMKGLNEFKKIENAPQVVFNIAGSTITAEDIVYRDKLYKLYFEFAYSSFLPVQMPLQYQRNHLLVHTSRTGSMDKVVLEALAAGRIVVTSSEAYAHLADGELKDVVFRFPPGDYKELANVIDKIYHSGILAPDKLPNQKAINYVREHHNLDTLIGKIISYFAIC